MKLLPVVFFLTFSSLVAANEDAQNKGPEAAYQEILVSKVQIEADKDLSNADELKWYDDLENEATAYIVKTFKGEGFSASAASEITGQKAAIITTNAKFNPGNQAVRWVGGLFGAGKATADVTMSAVDSETKAVIATKNYSTTMRMGGLGGSSRSFFIGAVDGAWNELYGDVAKLVKTANR